ncbi:MAG: S9 family peptidase [Proteobacteria bacterium]|nr:S9 family peptidase [Pseudomonadota bacterium]
MTRWLTAIALGLLTSAATAVPVLQGPPPRAITDPHSIDSPRVAGTGAVAIADLFKTAESLSAVWSADGSAIIYSSDQSGRLNLWRQPVAGGAPMQLTHAEDRQWFQQATADGRAIVFQSDRGGREIYDLYMVPAGGGEAVNLTATEEASETFPVLSRDGKWVAYSSRPRTEPATDLGVMELATRQMRLLTHERSPSMMWIPVAFSADGRTLLANRTDIMRAHGAVYRIDVASGAATRLTADEAGAYSAASDWSADGRWIGLTTETAAGDRQAAILDLRSGAVHLLKPDHWEQSAGRFSPDGRTLLATSNVDGRDTVLAYDLAKRSVEPLPLPPGLNADAYFGAMPSFSPDGRQLLFPHQSGAEPLEYWVYDRASRQSHPVTRLATLATPGLPRTQVVHYRSHDGTVISAVLWVPANLDRNGRAPGVVFPHGGPTGQTKDGFDLIPIALASRGYLVIAPNPRGSTGYGRAFMLANQRDLGGGDLEDEIAGADFMVATGYVDPKRIGITGGSYGGFMTLMAVGKAADRWAAAVDWFGIVNWVSMYERGSPQLRHYQAGLIGDPVTDKDVYTRVSPLTYLGQTRAPLLVLQGENDIRVPKEESEQIVDFLSRQGKVVDVHYYPEEGHGFAKRENQRDAIERTVAWFERYLKAAP